ncbi:uncharacterized protein LOC130760680 isoform X3 [Actinidia eriantha]|uniref:uncharacterized protein LOC130760680 isoform X3 n=1 Tax=Actinidia eriantha TaxID=165200 RepID=UPI00258F4FE1|nr:uncharacterized protein LOC130760680 isoform X3 [Actinidia eriantha]XP_057472074.1 uncharacterized protein LOC130760680 isoform X3 [Actinidia eriantha]XP_057472075.1 uncharacterized protein LOC130760680 isoform X3 [Actinidia eriantha]XP_057472076.1 uncharacterized protein LOC130760680 isoform X3 [Actinidia eriantha]XP_057472077.1 uncharacterized protein LOC130760680 isoform X3 [Actinidia eriantha]
MIFSVKELDLVQFEWKMKLKTDILLMQLHACHVNDGSCHCKGNADGMGTIRKDELYKASACLKVPLQQVKILDHPDLQDGFGRVWNCELLARIVEEEILSHAIDLIITFDRYGVSGHCNHRDVNHGIRKLVHESKERDIEAWELVSTSILRKYSGPVDIWLSLIYAMYYGNGETHCVLNENPRKSYMAMAQHRSQWIWFRKLFVLFSSYTYVNTLKKIDP